MWFLLSFETVLRKFYCIRDDTSGKQLLKIYTRYYCLYYYMNNIELDSILRFQRGQTALNPRKSIRDPGADHV